MCTHATCPHGHCFIIPPHILEHIATNTNDPGLKQRALENLHLQGLMRGMRTGIGQFAFAGVSPGVLRRTIYDAQHKAALPGHLLRSETSTGSFPVPVNEAFDYSGDTYNFYRENFGRNSVDGKGMRLDSTIHYGKSFDNAFWNGQQMVYGDGDGQLFDRFTKCLDVVAHELTHGVTQFTAQLEYHDQPGALNESISDVFGTMVKQYILKQDVTTADWLIGAGLLIPKDGTNRTALRSMKAPGTAYDDPDLGKDPQPADMSGYYHGTADNGGVHINSGIPNRAFYLAAVAIGGNSWEVTGKIWYETLTTRLSSQSQFADAAAATRDIAKKYGAAAATAVDDAWTTVGL
ncbi:peptidase M4 [Burkholderia ubonensis]|uniref:Neutral metalloproteinase n=1 Tax=Burkholderia ubonensis TaxID=101571 RepID=A0A106PJZ0_9BURK|nr:M4 family metallopeptidase [Burkholderia ubonensis]KWA69564.1 peptidase M4 [Burkholderia ubonensis]